MLVGRDTELAAIIAALDSARGGRSAALCLVGDPGIGKSTLLQAAYAAGADFLRLRTVGIESELALGHAGLGDLLNDIAGHLGELAGAQREALDVALGRATTTSTAGPDPYLVAVGTLSLLAAAAERRPVLVVVDDFQWVDRESRRAIAFAARRLQHDRVAFVFARRSGSDAPELTGVTDLLVGGLDTRECQLILGPTVSAAVAEQLTGITGGNPLALTELAPQLSPAQRRGSAVLPPTLLLGERLTQGFELSLMPLSAAGRQALLLAAVSIDGQAGQIGAALELQGLDPVGTVGELEQAGVIQLSDGRYLFRHPLFRSITIQLATPDARRAAHAALAATLAERPALRARHLAEAAVGFDDEVATELLAAAEREQRRRGFAAAAALQERAGQLTSSAARQAHCYSAAAENALLSGDTTATRRLAGLVMADADDPDARAHALLTLGTLEQYAGSVPRSRELLDQAARLGTGVIRLRALAELANASYRLSSAQGMAAAAAALREYADPAEPEQEMLACYTSGAALAFGGEWDLAHPPMSRALELLETDPVLRDEPRYLSTAMLAPAWMGEPARILGFLDRRLDTARDMGALGVLPLALSLLAAGAAHQFGWHEIAYAYAGEAVEIGEELGFVTDVAMAYAVLAWELAARGEHDQAASSLARARQLDDRAEIVGTAVHVELVDAYAALCRGDLARVVEVLEARIAADGGRFPRGDYELGVAPELVEAYLGLGRRADAVALADRHAALHSASADPTIRGQAWRVRAMTSDDHAQAENFFACAHEAHASGSNAFETARTHLAHGTALRRTGRRIDARSYLRTAENAFSTMGLDGWAARARAELSASGQHARRGSVPGDALTSQETRVAIMVARGLSNKEIAAALFLSPKTVEHHVSSALRKRGLRTRTELAVAFSQS
ncbi:AAA family ATPase [Nakamurella sp. GG22]